MATAAPLSTERELLVTENLGLVRSQAHKFKRRGILDYDDLFSVGCEALLKAARKWPGMGKFSTYAMVCIQRLMGREVRRYEKLPQSISHDDLTDAVEGVPDADCEILESADRNRESTLAYLDLLPAPHRTALRLTFGIGLPAPLPATLASARMGTSECHFKRLLEDALARLRLLAASQSHGPSPLGKLMLQAA